MTNPNGIVYVLRRVDGLCKIGYTYNPRQRIADLRQEFGRLEVVHTIPTMSPQDLERYLHKQFASKRDGMTEWFALGPGDIQKIQMIRSHVHHVTFAEVFRGMLRWIWGI